MNVEKTNYGYYIQLVKGDKVMDSLTEFAKEHGLTSGTFSGIGAFRELTVGYFDTETQSYPERHFKETHEVLSCKGNFSLKDGVPFPHCHIVFADTDYNAKGGHLIEATVQVTGEFRVLTSDNEITREYDEEIGLHLWDF
ncbi:MAG: DUF296 domain-containing protein [Candidatus Marinimicrobia bacterium]|nr:DUF296 domain-containing protein [Candidatus Neomarinimicrobiota bacterium]MCF7828082.1 DUF296 domain-containing protein [Candidatus Neomarinimicrobiota bacterium]MCF7879743.1 DUF296 domain-containing protein [Candidatus Neomarinimicrobiota bacterium]